MMGKELLNRCEANSCASRGRMTSRFSVSRALLKRTRNSRRHFSMQADLKRDGEGQDPAPLRVVFLGTPEIAAAALNTMLEQHSNMMKRPLHVVGVISQPPARAKRNSKKLVPSPVHQLASESPHLSSSGCVVLTPERVSDPSFIEQFRSLKPDVAITAAYGQILSKEFLAIPKHGTLNIHPSLLPRWRGAAPIQRALQAGDSAVGVTVMYTVFAMDAGPIIAQERRELDGNEYSEELLSELFVRGAEMILRELDAVADGTAAKIEQDGSLVTHARKMTPEDGRLTFTANAVVTHNQVRAFASSPGTVMEVVLVDAATAESDRGTREQFEKGERLRLKVLRTEVGRAEGGMKLGVHEITLNKKRNALVVTCDDGSEVLVYAVQPPGKKPMDARSWWNGLRKRTPYRARVPH